MNRSDEQLEQKLSEALEKIEMLEFQVRVLEEQLRVTEIVLARQMEEE